MAYETKVILTLLSQQVAKCKTIKEAYTLIINAAKVEGIELPSYEDLMRQIEELQK